VEDTHNMLRLQTPLDEVGVGRCREVTGALDAALGIQVAALAEGEERQVDEAHDGHPRREHRRRCGPCHAVAHATTR
jgi:hypothetical protein